MKGTSSTGSSSRLFEKHSTILNIIRENKLADERVIARWFATIPYNVKHLVQDFDFDSKEVLDIGCSYGNSLIYWGQNSEGIEVQESPRQFLKTLNITTHSLNTEDGMEIGRRFDAVYSNNLFEHVLSPHLLLMRIHSLLRPKGLL